jgi:HPt (histidine-containing phosphotransfer) domain-containing protein
MADSAAIAEAMNRMWAKFLPDIEARVAVLENAASAICQGCLTAELREEASSAAHKLAGVLGTFGLDHGTVLAREAELLYARDGVPAELDGRPSALASQLRAVLAARNQ